MSWPQVIVAVVEALCGTAIACVFIWRILG